MEEDIPETVVAVAGSYEGGIYGVYVNTNYFPDVYFFYLLL